jgi:hypothetical protein
MSSSAQGEIKAVASHRFEQGPDSPENQQISETRYTDAATDRTGGAVAADLPAVINAWPKLVETVRTAILRLIVT